MSASQDGNIGFSALDVGQKAAINARPVRQFGLRPFQPAPQGTDGVAQAREEVGLHPAILAGRV